MKVSVDDSYRLLAAEHVRKQAKALARQMKGLRAGTDVECIHLARVASRRLRTALRMLCDCFPEKKVTRWRKAIRRLAQKLGAARDLDVEIAFVEDFARRVPRKDCQPGLARLVEQMKKRRAAIQPQVVSAAARLKAAGVLDEMRATSKKVFREVKGRRVTVHSPLVCRQAMRNIRRKLAKLRSYEDCLANPDDQACHHAMRIAVKQLRYTMEVCRPVYAGRLDRFIERAQEMQMLLGEIRDCDVWAMHLGEFLSKEREPAPLRIGIDRLAADRRAMRARRFRQLQEYWHRLDRQGFWEGLVRTLATCVRESVRSETRRTPAVGRTACRKDSNE